jgi:hypothetical protein
MGDRETGRRASTISRVIVGSFTGVILLNGERSASIRAEERFPGECVQLARPQSLAEARRAPSVSERNFIHAKAG